MRYAALLPLLLAGCQQSSGTKPTGRDEHPVGRYQMQPGVNPASVAVLDTRFGTVQNCFLLQFHYHCLAQTSASSVEGGLKAPQGNPQAPAQPN
jgi:hypothetical protein